MTPTTKTILERFEVRKSGKQKQEFRAWITPILTQNGWSVQEEKGFGGVRNLVIGDVEQAKVIYTAHYDTCRRLLVPNFIAPADPAVYLLYQVFLSIYLFASLFVPMILCGFVLGVIGAMIHDGLLLPGYYIGCFGCYLLMQNCNANPHNTNDNTSGVTAIIDLALSLPAEQRGKVAFILFDLEEAGLFGSKAFARKHQKIREHTLLVNLDCVSDGENMLFFFQKMAAGEVDRFRSAFVGDPRIEPGFMTKGFLYPSDQKCFKRGVGVTALRRTKGGLLYLNRIHTRKDTVYRSENIAWLVEGCIRLAEQL